MRWLWWLQGCASRGGGGGGGESGTQKFVYQKWLDKVFPLVNFVFSPGDHFGLWGGSRGGGVTLLAKTKMEHRPGWLVWVCGEDRPWAWRSNPKHRRCADRIATGPYCYSGAKTWCCTEKMLLHPRVPGPGTREGF